MRAAHPLLPIRKFAPRHINILRFNNLPSSSDSFALAYLLKLPVAV
jgi:hypothetical protein